MNLNKSARELLDRYLLGVKRALPGNKQNDITAEIESSILDRLEERYPQEQEISETQVKDILQELGSPRKLASSYSPQRYLISPRIFPAYLLVLRIVVLAVVGALILSLLIATLTGNTTTAGIPILKYLSTLWNGAFSAAAFVTLTFAIIERVNEDKDIEELEVWNKFNVEDLPELNSSVKQTTIPGTVFEIVLGVIGLAFLTYILNNNGQLPIFFNMENRMVQVRVFTDSFLRFMPFMMALAGLEVTRGAMLLVQGRQSSLTGWWHIILRIADIVLTVFLLGSFPLITLEGFQSLAIAPNLDFVRIGSAVNTGLRVILIISIFGTCVEIAQHVYREIKNPAG
jgi:hypothetical protein